MLTHVLHNSTQQFVSSTPLTRHSFSISSFSHASPKSPLFHWPPLTLPSPSTTSEHSQATHNCTHHCSMGPNIIRAFLCQRKAKLKKKEFLNVFVSKEQCWGMWQNFPEQKNTSNSIYLMISFRWGESREGTRDPDSAPPFSNICKRDIFRSQGAEREKAPGEDRGSQEAAGGSLSSFRSQGGIRSWPGGMSWAAQLSREAPVPGLTHSQSQVC